MEGSDQFGSSLAISANGKHVAIGARLNDDVGYVNAGGSRSENVWVYENNQGTWKHFEMLSKIHRHRKLLCINVNKNINFIFFIIITKTFTKISK